MLSDQSGAGRIARPAGRPVDPSQTLTGLPLVNRELGRRFLPQFLKGLVIGSLIVVALVALAFREWRLSIYALVPTVLGLVWAAGLLALARVELDLFALFAVVTFIGVGVDYGIHLVHRFQERGDAGRAVSELTPVILVAAAITLFGYGTLLDSSYPPPLHQDHLGRQCLHAGRRVGAGAAGAADGRARMNASPCRPSTRRARSRTSSQACKASSRTC
jgi:predicted RND superfamily exporter protein